MSSFNGANTPAFVWESNRRESMNYLIAILNSRLISEYLSQVCPPKLQGYSRYNVGNLNQIPIRAIDFDKVHGLQKNHDLVSPILLSSDQPDSVLEWIASALTVNNIVPSHDILAYLAEQMIAMHKDKQALTADFWTDLEGAADPPPSTSCATRASRKPGWPRTRRWPRTSTPTAKAPAPSTNPSPGTKPPSRASSAPWPGRSTASAAS